MVRYMYFDFIKKAVKGTQVTVTYGIDVIEYGTRILGQHVPSSTPTIVVLQSIQQL